jgi:hypothetical protein
MATSAPDRSVQRAIEEHRKRLIDLSRANRLLNFSHSKRSTL